MLCSFFFLSLRETSPVVRSCSRRMWSTGWVSSPSYARCSVPWGAALASLSGFWCAPSSHVYERFVFKQVQVAATNGTNPCQLVHALQEEAPSPFFARCRLCRLVSCFATRRGLDSRHRIVVRLEVQTMETQLFQLKKKCMTLGYVPTSWLNFLLVTIETITRSHSKLRYDTAEVYDSLGIERGKWVGGKEEMQETVVRLTVSVEEVCLRCDR